MTINISTDWFNILKDEFEKDYYLKLRQFLINEYKTKTIYPPMDQIFNALNYTSYENTKVLILGQDPYHGEGQAHGLSFSVKHGVKTPPSLRNMYKELNSDLGCYIPNHGYLANWAEQGVLMLNTSLTVRAASPNSHRGKGWEILTDEIIKKLNEREKPVVFILWGNNAISKEKFITNPQHLVIKSVHPSPLSASRGFFGSKPFSRTNEFLEKTGQEKINWQIENI